MEKFILEPLRGMGEIYFGYSREKVREIMGTPVIIDELTDYYFDGSIRFDYDESNILEFIEINNNEHFIVDIYGVNPFEIKANELVNLLTNMNDDGVVDKRRAPLYYIFSKISVAIYRDATEQDILTSIEEAKQDGSYEEDKEWLAEELDKYSHYQSIGMGKERIYTHNT
jgi:hypothetical protein